MKRILSLGAGVQSSTLALMAAHGEIEMPDCAIFADTQAEPESVYRWLDYLKGLLPFPVHRVTKGDLFEAAIKVNLSKSGKYWIANSPPMFAERNGRPFPIMRQCTTSFKIRPIQSKIKKMLAKGETCEQWIGISLDEAHRMKPSRDELIKNRWPLIDLRMTRRDCIAWMQKLGYPKPPKSSCVFCPYQSDQQWKRLKDEEPADFEKAVRFEAMIQYSFRKVGFEGATYLHRSLKPIDQVVFDKSSNQIDMFGNECEGMCGV